MSPSTPKYPPLHHKDQKERMVNHACPCNILSTTVQDSCACMYSHSHYCDWVFKIRLIRLSQYSMHDITMLMGHYGPASPQTIIPGNNPESYDHS